MRRVMSCNSKIVSKVFRIQEFPLQSGSNGAYRKGAQARRQPVPEQSGTWRLDLAVSLRARCRARKRAERWRRKLRCWTTKSTRFAPRSRASSRRLPAPAARGAWIETVQTASMQTHATARCLARFRAPGATRKMPLAWPASSAAGCVRVDTHFIWRVLPPHPHHDASCCGAHVRLLAVSCGMSLFSVHHRGVQEIDHQEEDGAQGQGGAMRRVVGAHEPSARRVFHVPG